MCNVVETMVNWLYPGVLETASGKVENVRRKNCVASIHLKTEHVLIRRTLHDGIGENCFTVLGYHYGPLTKKKIIASRFYEGWYVLQVCQSPTALAVSHLTTNESVFSPQPSLILVLSTQSQSWGNSVYCPPSSGEHDPLILMQRIKKTHFHLKPIRTKSLDQLDSMPVTVRVLGWFSKQLQAEREYT